MNAPVVTFDKDFWRKLIEASLPARPLIGDREALLRALVESIAKWMAENPNVGPHAERVRQITLAFDQWQKATERVGTVLRELGIEDATGRYQAENEAFIIFGRAAEGLIRWQRLYKPKEGTETYSLRLLRRLALLCCGPDGEERRHTDERGAGLTEAELEALFLKLADSGRLPVMLLDIKAFLRSRRDPATIRSATTVQRTPRR